MFKSGMKDDKQPVRKSSFWGIRCESGKKYSQIVNQKYHISMAALDPTSVKGGKEVVSLVVERDGSEFLLCNLQKDSVLQANLNLFFDKGEKVVFSLKGQGIVHLTGYLIKDDNDQNDGSLQSKALMNDSIMLAKDKVKASGGANKNVQSKKNLSTQNDSWKVESKAEISTPSKKLFASPPKKNSEKFQTNITGVLEGDDWNVENEEGISSASSMKNNVSPTKKSPSQKTPQKKLFGAAKEESEDSSSGDDDDDDEDDEETSDDNEDAKQLLRFAQKRPISSLEEEEDDDDEDDEDFEIDSSDESDEDFELPAKKKPSKDEQSTKKLKVETSTPLTGKKQQKSNVTEVIELDDDSKNGDMNSSIGRTPMPKKKSQSLLQKTALNDSKKAPPSKDEDSSDSDDEMETSSNKAKKTDKNKSASQLDASHETPSSEKKKKKKKKKKKASANDSTAANQSSVSANDSIKADDGDLSKLQYGKKLPGGVEYTDIRLGNGPEARKGKLAHVYYIGKLADNKVFDACQAAKDKPFIFKLGAGDVIKGWDLAIEGMKVGGKRRIKIPPLMGSLKKDEVLEFFSSATVRTLWDDNR
ncbi:unnamed protein product [Larinioides sclopetarius]|uniref:peptidylprolyl isomerase n=1 Tax=Larinioides sclopetarius TaxID=280406 RepID=A0AAV2AGY6_9ARAC